MARNGPDRLVWRWPLIGVDRKYLVDGQTYAVDPNRTLGLAGHLPGMDIGSRAEVGIVSLPRASNTAHIRLANGRFVTVYPLVSMNEARAGFEIS